MYSHIIFLSRNTVVLLVLLCVNSGSGEVRREELFPFGPSNGDTAFVRGSESTHAELVTLISPFTFFYRTHQKLYVNEYGSILFSQQGVRYHPRKCESITSAIFAPRIAPFWSAVYVKNGGHIYYRETTDPSLISKARYEVKKGFPVVGGNLSFKSVFIATWDNVAHYLGYYNCPDDNLRNTFQAILASDGKKSFVIFYYNQLSWTHFPESPICVPEDYYPASAGFTAGEGHPFQYILGDCESDVLKLTEKSNVDEMGKWVFRVDQGIESPTFREYRNTQDAILRGTSYVTPGFVIPPSKSAILGQKYVSPDVNTTDNNNGFGHSVSSERIKCSIGFYCYAILLILYMYI